MLGERLKYLSHNHAQSGLPDKGRAINELVVCITEGAHPNDPPYPTGRVCATRYYVTRNNKIKPQ